MNIYTGISIALFLYSFLMMHLYVLKRSASHGWINFELFRVIVEYIGLTINNTGRIGLYFYLFIISFVSFFVSLLLQLPSIRGLLGLASQ